MNQRIYFRLPINADEGFPQSFQLNFNDRAYRIALYVNVLEQETVMPDEHVYHLPELAAFMVMQVARQTAGTPEEIIFQRKLVTDLELEAAEVAFVFHQMRVAKRNLNGVGTFGSEVVGGIATRWPS